LPETAFQDVKTAKDLKAERGALEVEARGLRGTIAQVSASATELLAALRKRQARLEKVAPALLESTPKGPRGTGAAWLLGLASEKATVRSLPLEDVQEAGVDTPFIVTAKALAEAILEEEAAGTMFKDFKARFTSGPTYLSRGRAQSRYPELGGAEAAWRKLTPASVLEVTAAEIEEVCSQGELSGYGDKVPKLLGIGSTIAWGLAAGRRFVQLDFLGFGGVRFQFEGARRILVLPFDTAAEIVEQRARSDGGTEGSGEPAQAAAAAAVGQAGKTCTVEEAG
jgi:hypothetical protein